MQPLQLHRTLDQELAALTRGASLECLVCGEFVMHARGAIFCPECGMQLETEETPALGCREGALESETQAG